MKSDIFSCTLSSDLCADSLGPRHADRRGEHLAGQLSPASGGVGAQLVPVTVLEDEEHQGPGDEALLRPHAHRPVTRGEYLLSSYT